MIIVTRKVGPVFFMYGLHRGLRTPVVVVDPQIGESCNYARDEIIQDLLSMEQDLRDIARDSEENARYWSAD